jgi:hypothetical protein
MSKQQLTPWFSAEVKPARIGLYEVRYPEYPNEQRFRLWTGHEWKSEAGYGTLFGMAFGDKWRGLAEQPK